MKLYGVLLLLVSVWLMGGMAQRAGEPISHFIVQLSEGVSVVIPFHYGTNSRMSGQGDAVPGLGSLSVVIVAICPSIMKPRPTSRFRIWRFLRYSLRDSLFHDLLPVECPSFCCVFVMLTEICIRVQNEGILKTSVEPFPWRKHYGVSLSLG